MRGASSFLILGSNNFEEYKDAFIYLLIEIAKFQHMNNLAFLFMQSYSARALDRRLQVDWARDPREGPRVLMSLMVDFEFMG